jgi:hypothetical protein
MSHFNHKLLQSVDILAKSTKCYKNMSDIDKLELIYTEQYMYIFTSLGDQRHMYFVIRIFGWYASVVVHKN